MSKYIASSLVLGVICCHGAAQEITVAGASGVYVEVYNEAASKWERLGNFPDRHRTFPNGDPNPEPGLWGSELDEIDFGTIEGVFYSVFAVSPSIADIGDIEITGGGTIFIGRHVSVPPVLNRNFMLDAAGCNNLNSLTTPGNIAIVKSQYQGRYSW